MSNEVYEIKALEDTPAVILQKNKGVNTILIKGLSMPENALDFYTPLSEKIFAFFDENFCGISMEIDLHYMNSMSNKQLMKLIRGIAAKDNALKINWIYSPTDELIRMKGEEIKSIFLQLNMSLTEKKV